MLGVYNVKEDPFSSFLLSVSLWSRLAIYHIQMEKWLLKLFPGKGRGLQNPEKMGKWHEGPILVPQETKMRRQTQDFVHIPFNCFAYSHLQELKGPNQFSCWDILSQSWQIVLRSI